MQYKRNMFTYQANFVLENNLQFFFAQVDI